MRLSSQGDETLSGGAEGRGHGEFRRQCELRGQTEKRRAGALKTLQVTDSRMNSSSSSKIPQFTSSIPQIHTCTPVEAL